MIKKVSNTANVWSAVAIGRKVYRGQMDKTSEIKTKSMKYALELSFPTYHAFGKDLDSAVELLCDSKRFDQECQDLKLDPKVVAQNVIFEGQKVFQQVRDFGVKAIFSKRVCEFNQPIFVEAF